MYKLKPKFSNLKEMAMAIGVEKLLSEVIFVFFHMYMQLALLLNHKYGFN